MTTASLAARPAAPCSMCCATKTWKACWPPWFGFLAGVKLGAGGLVRAYTDAVAQALLTATKVPRVPMCELRCAVPYAWEGWLRREIELAQAQLLSVSHGRVVQFHFKVPQSEGLALQRHLNEGGQGRLVWLPSEPAP
jgi:putative IMPACT (imprinted ancient) family translation regulator